MVTVNELIKRLNMAVQMNPGIRECPVVVQAGRDDVGLREASTIELESERYWNEDLNKEIKAMVVTIE